MSRRSVRTYVKSLLIANTAGITVSDFIPKVQPLVDTAAVLRMESHEERKNGGTLPRGGGHKLVKHKIYVGVANSDIDEAAATHHHDDLIQALIQLIRTVSLNPNPQLVDNTANPPETSYVKYIGETIDVQMDRAQQLANAKGTEAEVAALSNLVISLDEEILHV